MTSSVSTPIASGASTPRGPSNRGWGSPTIEVEVTKLEEVEEEVTLTRTNLLVNKVIGKTIGVPLDLLEVATLMVPPTEIILITIVKANMGGGMITQGVMNNTPTYHPYQFKTDLLHYITRIQHKEKVF